MMPPIDQFLYHSQEKEKELKEPEDMKYKHIEKDSEDFFLLGLLNSVKCAFMMCILHV